MRFSLNIALKQTFFFICTVGEIFNITTKKQKKIMLPLKNITPSLKIQFVVSCNKDKLLKLDIHLGNIINSVLEI